MDSKVITISHPPLANIDYGSNSREEDILRHVFRWDLTPYQEVFRNGFQARRQQDTLDEVYYNLDHYVYHEGRPLDATRPATHAFHPNIDPNTQIEVYRYEIYAPVGIWVAETLSDHYQYAAQDEVSFVAGIAPQCIWSGQRFGLIADTRFTRSERVDNVIRVNGNYDPQSYPSRFLNIRRPIFDYFDENGTNFAERGVDYAFGSGKMKPSSSPGISVHRLTTH
ncbi:hypothetical protein ACSBR1_029912 [Camellia fascicularis]